MAGEGLKPCSGGKGRWTLTAFKFYPTLSGKGLGIFYAVFFYQNSLSDLGMVFLTAYSTIYQAGPHPRQPSTGESPVTGESPGLWCGVPARRPSGGKQGCRLGNKKKKKKIFAMFVFNSIIFFIVINFIFIFVILYICPGTPLWIFKIFFNAATHHLYVHRHSVVQWQHFIAAFLFIGFSIKLRGSILLQGVIKPPVGLEHI